MTDYSLVADRLPRQTTYLTSRPSTTNKRLIPFGIMDLDRHTPTVRVTRFWFCAKRAHSGLYQACVDLFLQ